MYLFLAWLFLPSLSHVRCYNYIDYQANVALCNVSRYVTKSRDMRESDLVRDDVFRTVLLQSAGMLYDRRCL